MPDELQREVCDTVQEAVTKTIRKEEKCKKAKWLSEEALQISEKENQKTKEKRKDLNPFECRVTKNSKER